MRNFSQAIFLLLIYFLVTFGYTFSLGFYYLPGFILLILAFLLLATLYFFPKIFENFKVENPQPIFAFGAILSIALSLVAYGGLYQSKGGLFYFSLFLLAIALLLSFSYFFPLSQSSLLKHRFLVFLTIAFFLRLFMILSSPNPTIDVFDILKNGPKALLSGKNPYSVTFTQLYEGITADYFAYPPGILLLVTPVVWLLNDPRYIFLIAELGTAFLIYLLLRKSGEITEVLPVLFLFGPRSLFVLEQSWIDPVLVFLILLFYFLLVGKTKIKNFAYPVLGVFLTIKQTAVFFPLLLLKRLKLTTLNISAALFVTLLTVLPFLLWNPKEFLNDTFWSYLNFPEARKSLLQNSLSIPAFLFQQFRIEPPQSVGFILSSIWLVIILFIQHKNWSQVFLALSLFFLGFHLFNRIAFADHYYFVGNLLVLGIVAMLKPETVPNED